MNGRRFLLNCLAVLAVSLPLRGAVLPPVVRTSTNAASARTQIVPHVEKWAAALKQDNDATAAKQIIDEVLPGSGATAANPSAPFLDAYADVVNTEMLKLANDPNPRVRLNAAIVAAKVGENAKNYRLIPTIVDLLDDPNEAVVTWALKATRGVLIPAHTPAGGMQGAKLMPAFTAAARKYVTSGPMTQISYDTLKVVEAGTSPPPAPAIKSALDAVHEILKARRELYIKGMPEFPSAESSAVSFLAKEKNWRAQSPAQQFTTIQFISDLTGLIAQRYGNAGAIERAEMAKMLEYNGGALTVIGKWTNSEPKMEVFAKPLNQVRSIADPQAVMDVAKATYEGLKTFAAWKDLKPFPEIEK